MRGEMAVEKAAIAALGASPSLAAYLNLEFVQRLSVRGPIVTVQSDMRDICLEMCVLAHPVRPFQEAVKASR